MTVAQAVAEEIENNLSWGKDFLSPNFGTRPVLLALPVSERNNKQATVTCRYEGGCVVKVFLEEEGGSYIGDKEMEYWSIIKVESRFYLRTSSGHQTSNEKTSMVFGCDELVSLKGHRWWHHPHVKMSFMNHENEERVSL